ncbi:hypothetical protein IPJ70_03965 [Candidatus Campbellbacteria bacterium]|nr:MAG: hypothetical protein IPJ70_03965 [Candidatus Campbellbacteria bacterium]
MLKLHQTSPPKKGGNTMCLLCNSALPHNTEDVHIGDVVKFSKNAPETFREKYPGELVVTSVQQVPDENREKGGCFVLSLATAEPKIEVEVSGVNHFSSDFFEWAR